MERILGAVENAASRYLTKRKAERLYQKNKKKTILSEALEWVDALLFGVFWVLILNQFLFQLFVIPSPSMVSTLLVKDRVVVNKDAYGVEVYPGGPKVASEDRRVQRDDIITFYNPEYESKGPVFDILSQAIYMGTLSLVNIDKNEDGTMAERLYVKRAAALGGDYVVFEEGNVSLKAAGTGDYEDEETFRSRNGLSSGPNRTVDSTMYDGLKAAAALTVYKANGITSYPQYLVQAYSSISNSEWNYRFDPYEYWHSYRKTERDFNPSDMEARSALYKYEAGIYVPEGSILPLGDNRDNSQDGRYFGPVKEAKVNGQVVARFWPISRLAILTDD